MDAGHIAGTIELLAESLDLRVRDINSIDEDALNQHLSIDGFDEVLMAGLFLVSQL
jgi:hypothetical protein